MASSAAQPEIASELEKKKEMEEDENPEEPMDDDDDEDAGEGDDGDVEEDVVVQIGDTYSCKRQDGSFHDAEIVRTRMNKQAGREEFFVHYVGLNRRQNEWVEKTRLVIPKPEGQVENSTDPETSEDGKATLKRKNEDGASEAKRAKVTVETPPSSDSVIASGDFADELICLLCSELFKDPVMVECGHNFCRNCIDQAWNGQESFTCPDCKEVITDKRYTTNRALANLLKKTVGNTAAPAKPTEKPKPTENCPEHDERLKLYCKDDGMLCCVICRESLKHANHNFLPILDAAGLYRTELSAIVAPLEEALKMTEQLTTKQSEKVEQHKRNVTKSQEYIMSQFEELRTFFKEREKKLLERLQDDGENLLKEMETNMVNLQDSHDNIEETIATANEKMNDTDSICFLTGIKSFIEKCEEEQKAVMVAGSALLSKDLCMGTFKGPIQYSIWKQLKSIIKPPESFQEPTSCSGPETLPLPSVPAGVANEQMMDSTQNSDLSAVKSNHHAKKTVWIVGHSFVYYARNRAARCFTQSDRLSHKCSFIWFGQKDLMWSGMKKLVDSAANQAPPPDILIIHAGGNDLESIQSLPLSDDIRADIDSWLKRWPEVKVIWSNIIRRNCWFGTSVQERRRIKVNADIAKFLLPKGGLVLDHTNITFGNNKMYSPDGEQLSELGLQRFDSNLYQMVNKCVSG